MSTLYLKTNIKHPFHIVDPSPWPVQVSMGAMQMLVGIALYAHLYEKGLLIFTLGLICTTLGTCFWWRDIVREATFEGHHTVVVQQGLKFGMVLFILSEVMLFFAFFWAYFHSSLNPVLEIGAVWPPKGIEVINPYLIPLLNTALLLTSGASLTWSHSALIGGYRMEAIAGLIFTMILATIFTLFQVYEYLNAPFDISDGIYGTTFYSLTGLHGFHVIVGTIFLGVSLWRLSEHHFTTGNHIGYECAAWYWHFVDVVWIFLFIVVYTWGEGV